MPSKRNTVMAAPYDKRLKFEILNLSQYIERFRAEIARLNKGAPDANFKNMSAHLDAIIAHTDSATHEILKNLEEISDLVGRLQEKTKDAEAAALCDKAMEKTTTAMEACTFQDITGQRVTKIIRSMQFVEERVVAMVELMGRDSVEREPIPAAKLGKDPLLNGPQLPGNAISQDDIDKLFA
ncbi:MAG: protein phosphatase CheZ [Alphaproteobacteria bacterium]